MGRRKPRPQRPPKHRSAKARDASRPQTVADLMSRNFITVDPADNLFEALQLMRAARLRHLLVERDGVLVGVLSYRDVQEESASQLDEETRERQRSLLGEVATERAMGSVPEIVTPDMRVDQAAARLFRFRVGCLPVVEETPQGPRLVGLITETDLLRAAYDPWFSRRPD